jgi:hypothetical protein
MTQTLYANMNKKKKKKKLVERCTLVIPSLGRLRQEDREFKASLSYRMRSS